MTHHNKSESNAEDTLQHYKEHVSVPKDGLVRLLNNLPSEKKVPFHFPWKLFVPVMAVMFIAVAGDTFYRVPQSANPVNSNSQNTISSGSNSDAAIAQEVSAIDTQLSGLSSDTSNADQALNGQYQ